MKLLQKLDTTFFWDKSDTVIEMDREKLTKSETKMKFQL